MKIRITDWNCFEKRNAIYFTRDINIVNDFNVYAMQISKKGKKLLVYMDFISSKYLGFIKLNDCVMISDNNIPNDWIYKEKLILNIFIDDLFCQYYQKYSLENIFAPEWMTKSNFFVDLHENPVMAEEEFLSHMK